MLLMSWGFLDKKKLLLISLFSLIGALILGSFGAFPSYGHPADLSVAKILVKPQNTKIYLTLPTSFVAFADDNKNDQLSLDEIRKHQIKLQEFFADQIILTTHKNQKRTISIDPANQPDLSVESLNSHRQTSLLLKYDWSEPITQLKIRYQLFKASSQLNPLSQQQCLATIDHQGYIQSYIFTPLNQTLSLDFQGNSNISLAQNGLMAILFAFIWGAFHALSPGHGKTLVGAYLVGSRANIKHAIFLGLTTTITHTIGVFALGIVALFASQYILPESFYPWLSLLSGVLVLIMGITLFYNRFRSLKNVVSSTNTQPHYHHSHSHDHHDHDHHHHQHSHVGIEDEETPVTWNNLLTLGIAGGLVPCPAALILLLSTASLGTIGWGILLVFMFSLGLAVTLTGLGFLLLKTKYFFKKFSTPIKSVKFLSIASAFLIILIGLGLTYRALLQI